MHRPAGLGGNLWRHGVIWLFIVFAVGPIIWVLSASFDPTNSLVTQQLIPTDPTTANYEALFSTSRHPFGLWIWNSFKVSILTAFFALVLTSLAAYAFSRFRFQGRRGGLLFIMIVQIFPQMLMMVAIYLLLLSIGRYVPALGINTHLGLIMVYLGGAMGINTWLVKGFFDTIPSSLEESAFIDGATPFDAFWRIILPLARPILAVVLLLIFIGTYSEYILARVLLSSTDSYTLAVGLQLYISDQYGQRWGIFSAASILGAIPMVVLFLFLQRFLISGLTRGAVKE